MSKPKNNKDQEIVSQETIKPGDPNLSDPPTDPNLSDPPTDPNPNSIYITKGTKPSGEDLPLTQEKIGEKQTIQTKIKKGFNQEGIYKKKYVNEHGAIKHYVKVDQPQEESTDDLTGLEIMIYSDSKRECSYFTNLSDKEINSYKLYELAEKSEE